MLTDHPLQFHGDLNNLDLNNLNFNFAESGGASGLKVRGLESDEVMK